MQAQRANFVKWVHSDDNSTIFRDGPLLLTELRAQAQLQHACRPPLPAPRPASAAAEASAPAGHNPRKRIAVPAAAAGGAGGSAAAAPAAVAAVLPPGSEARKKARHQEQGVRVAAARYEVACCEADRQGEWEDVAKVDVGLTFALPGR